ncbi:unnamed protein product [Caretta caretta]
MALLLHKAVFPLLVWLIASASCYQPTSKPEAISHPRRHLFRIREWGAQKPVPGRLLAWQKGKVYPFAVGERGDPGQEIQRVRRSWLADYMDDLWTHIRGSFPRAALYAFPFALGIMLLLCCITHIYHSSQFSIIRKFAESAIYTILQIIYEDIEQNRAQDRPQDLKKL